MRLTTLLRRKSVVCQSYTVKKSFLRNKAPIKDSFLAVISDNNMLMISELIQNGQPLRFLCLTKSDRFSNLQIWSVGH